MCARGKEYDCSFKPSSQVTAPNSKRIGKALNNITKLYRNQGSGPWGASEVASLDKSLLELLRIFEKNDTIDKEAFSSLNGFEKITELLGSLILSDVVSKGNKKQMQTEENKENPPMNVTALHNKRNKESSKSPSTDELTDDSLSIDSHDVDNPSLRPPSCVLPPKSVGLCSKVIHGALKYNPNNSRHMLYSNLVSVLLDLLMQRLAEMTLKTSANYTSAGSPIVNLPSDPAVTNTLLALSEVLSVVSSSDLSPETNQQQKDQNRTESASWLRLQDMISYCVCVGVADRVSWYLSHVQGPGTLEVDAGVVELILAAMSLLSSMANCLQSK